MLKYLKQILSISLLFLITIGLAIPAFGMEKPTIGLLKINNYSGVDTVSGNKLERLVVEEFVENIKKQSSIQFIDHEKVKELMRKKSLIVTMKPQIFAPWRTYTPSDLSWEWLNYWF